MRCLLAVTREEILRAVIVRRRGAVCQVSPGRRASCAIDCRPRPRVMAGKIAQPGSRKRDRALATLNAANCSIVWPRAAASAAAVCTTLAGSLRLPRSGCWRKIRAVSLDQDAIVGNRGGDVSQVLRILVGDHAGEADVQAERDAFGGTLGRAGEGVHHAPQWSALPRLAQHGQHIGLALAGVNDERQIVSLGQPHVAIEIILLHVEAARSPSSDRARSRRRRLRGDGRPGRARAANRPGPPR